MLVPVLMRVNVKVTGATVLTLENLLGSNLPLLFPEITIMNRTVAADSLTVSGQTRHVYTNQTDPDFNGAVLYATFTSFSVGNGQTQRITTLPNSLTPTPYGVTTEVTLTNSGPEPEALVSVVIKGMVETAVSADPRVISNG